MASTREERMQQRLRGAQRRQVKDVDFNLTFPTVPNIPQAAQQAVLSQSTPPAAPASSGRGQHRGATVRGSNPSTSRSTANDANISAKRRKLNSDQPPSSSTRTTRSSLHAPGPDTYALPEGGEREEPAATTGNDPSEEDVERDELEIPSQAPSEEIAQISLAAPITEVVTESPAHAPGSGHRMRVSLDEAALQSVRLQDGLVNSSPAGMEQVSSSPAQKRKRRMGDATPESTIQSNKRLQRNPATQEDDGELDELSPDQPRGRSRKPKQLEREKALSMAVDEEDIAQHSAEEAEEINDAEAAVILKKSRGMGRPSIPAAGSPDLDEPTPVATKEKRGRPSKVSTPAQQRQPKPAASQAQAKPIPKTSKKSSKPSKVRVGSPIPIIVHRFTERPLYDDDDSDADILNSEIPYIRRGGVNAIDVLIQVCHEIIDSGLDTLAEGGRKADDSALRREYKTKWSAVEAFGRELQNRLLEHTINLDNSFALERRVREERKKRLALREDILRVRAEREQIALRMDEVRMKHEAESKNAQERDSLNNTIHDIELALERGKQQHPNDNVRDSADVTGIELVLKRVAGEVSSKSDSGGILKQVREFNAFLERAALALETRRS